MIYRNKLFKTVALFILTIIFVNFKGCVYSFTGASVPPHLKTIAIPIFEDRSGFSEPGLREEFTDKLTQLFIDDNTFQITDKTNADALLECAVTNLTDEPVVVSGGESVTTRRIKINVKVIYRDLVNKENIFDKTFSNSGDYDATSGGFESRQSGIETAVQRISEDILLSTVSNW